MMITALMIAATIGFSNEADWSRYLQELDKVVIKICDARSIYPEMCREDITECVLDDGDLEWCVEDYFDTTEDKVQEIDRFCNSGFIMENEACTANLISCYRTAEDLQQCLHEYKFPKL